jgi:hypothetical protein
MALPMQRLPRITYADDAKLVTGLSGFEQSLGRAHPDFVAHMETQVRAVMQQRCASPRFQGMQACASMMITARTSDTDTTIGGGPRRHRRGKKRRKGRLSPQAWYDE